MIYMISSLATYVNLSPSCNSPRNHTIDTITIHCMAGQMYAKSCADMFANPSVETSANYCIGRDGDIACSVDENDRSWCSSSPENDNRAITIEVASDASEPCNVNPEAYEALIKLCVDICKRNNIKELKWKADKNLIGNIEEQNMTVHRWFSWKSCPGEFLYSHMGDIAARVNEQLGEDTPETEAPKVLYRVQVGAFANKDNAVKLKEELESIGYATIIVSDEPTYPEPTPAPVPKKSIGEIASEVLEGKWGNGDARKEALRAAGYDPAEVQRAVNARL